MTEKSTAFEQRVERIYRLLEQQDATVTWNEKLPDPDNPDQARQIDVAIRRQDSLTIVECRIHRAPQDVMWIEQLMGRRTSLCADAVIAVSASGFTEGARAKAARYGIILRDFATLTQEEIRDWGKQKRVQLCFFEFTDSMLVLRLPSAPAKPYAITDYLGNPVNWRGLFESVMRRLEGDEALDRSGSAAQCEMEFNAPIFVNGVSVLATRLKSTVRRITRDISTASLVAYADSLDGNRAAQAVVGSLDLGASEIVEVSDRVSIVVDLSQVKLPPNSLLHTILYDFGRVVMMSGTNFIGLMEAMDFDMALRVQIQVA